MKENTLLVIGVILIILVVAMSNQTKTSETQKVSGFQSVAGEPVAIDSSTGVQTTSSDTVVIKGVS